jgi:hypothetical protein
MSKNIFGNKETEVGNKENSSSKNEGSYGTSFNIHRSKYMTEFSSENSTYESYITKGVLLDDVGDKLKLSYNGLLAKSGATEVYAVVGIGENKNWNDIKYLRMDNLDGRKFEAILPTNNKNINVVFKDCANNWDNNSGQNYSFNM